MAFPSARLPPSLPAWVTSQWRRSTRCSRQDAARAGVSLAIFMLQSRHIVCRLCAVFFFFFLFRPFGSEMWQQEKRLIEATAELVPGEEWSGELGLLWALVCLEMVTKCVISVMQRHSAAQREMRGSRGCYAAC